MPNIGGSSNQTNPLARIAPQSATRPLGAPGEDAAQQAEQQNPAPANNQLSLSQSARTVGHFANSVDPSVLAKLRSIHRITYVAHGGRGLHALSLGAQGFAQATQAQTKFDKLGNAGLAVGGVFGAADLPGAIAAFLHDPNLASGGRIVSDAANVTQGVDGALRVAKLGGFLGDKLNPGISIVGDVGDMPQEVVQILNGKAPVNQRVGAGLYLAGDAIDATGSTLMCTGIAAPVGVVLQAVAAGVMVAGFAVENFQEIEHAIEHPVRTLEDLGRDAVHVAEKVGHAVESVGKKVLHALNPLNWF